MGFCPRIVMQAPVGVKATGVGDHWREIERSVQGCALLPVVTTILKYPGIIDHSGAFATPPRDTLRDIGRKLA